jgi:hypothetical protein
LVTLARRELIAYHEAGHAVVGHHQGLTFGVIYIGDAGGQVLFDEQWTADEVLGDPQLLDRYGLMLLAAACAEERCVGSVVGAESDVDTIGRMIVVARERGTHPRVDSWRRAEEQVVEHWREIDLLAGELIHRSTPVADLAEVLANNPDLGSTVDELTGAQARGVLSRNPVAGIPRVPPAGGVSERSSSRLRRPPCFSCVGGTDEKAVAWNVDFPKR